MRDPNQTGQSATLGQVIETFIDKALVNVHTSMPGFIESYDASKQVADVRLAIKQEYYTQTGTRVAERPILTGVPVIFPRAADYYKHIPIEPGDAVWVLFSMRSLDVWKVSGDVVDPKSTRKFNPSDAVCIPGASAPKNAVPPENPLAVQEVIGDLLISYQKNGKIKVQNPTAELVSTLNNLAKKLSTLCDTLSKDKVNTMLGPQPLLSFATYEGLKNDIDELQSEIESFKVV